MSHLEIDQTCDSSHSPESLIVASSLGLRLKRGPMGNFALDVDQAVTVQKVLNAQIAELFLVLERIESMKVQIIYPWEIEFRLLFRDIECVPPLLFVFGDRKSLLRPGIAVIGSRKMHGMTERWMETHLVTLNRLNSPPSLISGGAVGVDQCVHKTSLALNLPTVVWLPSGHLQLYPDNLGRLANLLVSTGGCLVSPYWPLMGVRKFHFHERNRWMVSQAQGVLVCQAGPKSGSLMTGMHALKVGRPLGVVLGHPMDSEFRGNYELYAQGGDIIFDQMSLHLFAQRCLAGLADTQEERI